MGCKDSVEACWGTVLDGLFYFRSLQQFFALYRKNALVAWRNRRATILRILAPLLFMILALIIDKAVQANQGQDSEFSDVPNPATQAIGGIPQCWQDLYIGKGKACKEVLYSPSPNTVVDTIMTAVRKNNDVPITVQGFANRSAIQTYLFNNPDTVLAAVHFEVTGSLLEGFIVQTNTTDKFFKGKYQHPNKFVQLPLQTAVHREIARYQLTNSGLSNATSLASSLTFQASLKPFAHPAIATRSVLGSVLGPFVFAALMFSFVIQIGVVVGEKELGLKQALRTMGMTDTAYWTSWGLWEVTLAFFVAHSIVIYGLILQFKLFLHNNYGLLFFLFFLFQLAMSSLALFLSAFIRRTQVAVYLGFTIFIVGWIMQTVVLFDVPYSPDMYAQFNYAITVVFSLFPWDLLAKGFNDLGSAVMGTSPGLEWSQRSSYCLNIPNTDDQPPYNPSQQYLNFSCVMSLNQIYGVLIALWLGYFVLAIYFDNIMPNEFGVRKPFWYIFLPSYWCPGCVRAQSKLKLVQQSVAASTGHGRFNAWPLPPKINELDDDVREEEDKMLGLLEQRTGGDMQEVTTGAGRNNAVEVYGLSKLYKGSNGCFGSSVKCCECCSCCSCEKTDDFWAIKGSWFAIEQGQLFCLLGPNGAGKTTTINCLTGAIPPTGGEALVYDEPISNPGGLDSIRSKMGVCPQFDILWNELNGAEHLSIYGHIKGLHRRKVTSDLNSLLEKVKLTYAAKQRAGSYSGGMKRRLSVAIALLGDPRIVYLDEPTTGMDPISRRYVWDIIQEAKQGRAIVLTTHSMEEADILGDRIAIMARGKLRCLGTSLRLKQRFGSGYTLAVSVTSSTGRVTGGDADAGVEARVAGVKRFFQDKLGLAPVEESKAYMHFLVDREKEPQLNGFLAELEANRTALGITDVQLSLTSLEEVFLNIARKAEMEAAQQAGQSLVTHVMDDGSKMQIPVGAELVAHPVTHVAYKVRWGTDEAGRLVILDTTAVPSVAAPMVPPPGGAVMPYGPGAGYGNPAPPVPGAFVPATAVPTAPPAGLAAGVTQSRPGALVMAPPVAPVMSEAGPMLVTTNYPGYNPSPLQSGANR